MLGQWLPTTESQGLTLKKSWIDLGPSEKVAGLTYVALSRVCKISDLLIEPMTFERLHSLKKTSNYRYRLLEEERLNTLAQITLENFNNPLWRTKETESKIMLHLFSVENWEIPKP